MKRRLRMSAATTEKMCFIGNCVALNGDKINEMRAAACEITRLQFCHQADRDERLSLEASLGYRRDFPMSQDWYVSYYKSIYNGRPCVYFVWSAYEFVFTGASC